MAIFSTFPMANSSLTRLCWLLLACVGLSQLGAALPTHDCSCSAGPSQQAWRMYLPYAIATVFTFVVILILQYPADAHDNRGKQKTGSKAPRPPELIRCHICDSCAAAARATLDCLSDRIQLSLNAAGAGAAEVQHDGVADVPHGGTADVHHDGTTDVHHDGTADVPDHGAHVAPAATPLIADTLLDVILPEAVERSPESEDGASQQSGSILNLVPPYDDEDGDAASSVSGAPGMVTIKVVSVDDEPINHMILRSLLCGSTTTTTEYKLVELHSGEELLQYMLAEVDSAPDVILLDVSMTGITGYEAVAVLRQTWTAAQLPIIMLTGSSSEEAVIDGLESGASDYIIKPLRGDELKARINTQVALKQSIRSALEAASNLDLLRSILPPDIIKHLKQGRRAVAQYHGQVTVLFSDIKSFTNMASSWPTEKVICLLNSMFSAFDELCEHIDVYKVETIGDAYMIVSGHDGVEDHALRMMRMASAMIEAVEAMGEQWAFEGQPLQIRVGVHTGPAHSGVVGTIRPRYCFFGDTVNVASRMEANSFPMAVHVSDATRASIVGLKLNEEAQDPSESLANLFVPCGPRMIKGKGIMHTHLLRTGGWKEALAELVEASSGPGAAEKAYVRRPAHSTWGAHFGWDEPSVDNNLQDGIADANAIADAFTSLQLQQAEYGQQNPSVPSRSGCASLDGMLPLPMCPGGSTQSEEGVREDSLVCPRRDGQGDAFRPRACASWSPRSGPGERLLPCSNNDMIAIRYSGFDSREEARVRELLSSEGRYQSSRLGRRCIPRRSVTFCVDPQWRPTDISPSLLTTSRLGSGSISGASPGSVTANNVTASCKANVSIAAFRSQSVGPVVACNGTCGALDDEPKLAASSLEASERTLLVGSGGLARIKGFSDIASSSGVGICGDAPGRSAPGQINSPDRGRGIHAAWRNGQIGSPDKGRSGSAGGSQDRSRSSLAQSPRANPVWWVSSAGNQAECWADPNSIAGCRIGADGSLP